MEGQADLCAKNLPRTSIANSREADFRGAAPVCVGIVQCRTYPRIVAAFIHRPGISQCSCWLPGLGHWSLVSGELRMWQRPDRGTRKNHLLTQTSSPASHHDSVLPFLEAVSMTAFLFKITLHLGSCRWLNFSRTPGEGGVFVGQGPPSAVPVSVHSFNFGCPRKAHAGFCSLVASGWFHCGLWVRDDQKGKTWVRGTS